MLLSTVKSDKAILDLVCNRVKHNEIATSTPDASNGAFLAFDFHSRYHAARQQAPALAMQAAVLNAIGQAASELDSHLCAD